MEIGLILYYKMQIGLILQNRNNINTDRINIIIIFINKFNTLNINIYIYI